MCEGPRERYGKRAPRKDEPVTARKNTFGDEGNALQPPAILGPGSNKAAWLFQHGTCFFASCSSDGPPAIACRRNARSTQSLMYPSADMQRAHVYHTTVHNVRYLSPVSD
eukprot:4923166-Pyramimonas_sp.AAC.1